MPRIHEWALFVFVAIGTHPAGQRAVSVVEAKVIRALGGERTEVPLAHECRFVAGGLECTRERDGVPRERAFVLRSGDSKATPAATRQKAGAGRAAHGGDIVGGEFEAFACESVELRGRGVASVKRHIGPAEIVG
jgi:hypothetical protein